MASLATLRVDTRRLLDETDSSNSNFQDTELTDYLNKALRKVATELEWPIARATATSVSGQAHYALPSNFLLLLDVFFDGKKLDFKDLQDMPAHDSNYLSASPDLPKLAYHADNDQIGLYPAPSIAYAAKSIYIDYIKFATDLSADADVPDLLTVVADLLPYWAANLANLRAGNLKTADYFRGLYASEMKILKPKVVKFSEELLGLRWE